MNDAHAAKIGRPKTLEARLFPEPDALAARDEGGWIAACESPYILRPKIRSGPAGQLLWLTRAAMLAEAQGRRSVAEFYWTDIMARCDRLTREPKKFEGAIHQAARVAGVNADVVNVWRQFVDEVLIDGLVASYNRLADSPEPAAQDAARVHLRRISTLLSHSRMSASGRAATTRPAVEAQALRAQSAQQWVEAAAMYRDLFALDPTDESALEGLVENLWLQGRSTTANARSRGDCVKELEELSARVPLNATIYDALAQLYLSRSIDLANDHHLPEALESIERSLAANPDDQAQQIKGKLTELMNSLRGHAATIQTELKSRPGTRLTVDGQRIVNQARVGFGLANAFLKSPEADKRVVDSGRARLRRFWRRLGLAEPVDAWDERASRLTSALGAILTSAPDNAAQIAAEWKRAVTEDPELADLKPAGIIAFLNARLSGGEWEPAQIVVPRASPSRRAYSLGSVEGSGSDKVPFQQWLLSTQDRGLKWRAAAAAVLVVVAGSFMFKESRLVARRDAAIERLMFATQAGDPRAALDAAGDFLSSKGLCPDVREEQVVDVYKRSLVRWISSVSGDLEDQDKAVVDRYRRLVATVTGV